MAHCVTALTVTPVAYNLSCVCDDDIIVVESKVDSSIYVATVQLKCNVASTRETHASDT